MSSVKRPTTKFSKEQFYVDPNVLKEQIKLFYQTEVCEDALAINIQKISEGLSYSPSFINYTFRDEMVGDAIVKMFTALVNKKFNIDSETNPFSYFTTIAFNAFINRIKKEKKQYDALTSYRDATYEQMLSSGTDDYHIYTAPTLDESDDYNDE